MTRTHLDKQNSGCERQAHSCNSEQACSYKVIPWPGTTHKQQNVTDQGPRTTHRLHNRRSRVPTRSHTSSTFPNAIAGGVPFLPFILSKHACEVDIAIPSIPACSPSATYYSGVGANAEPGTGMILRSHSSGPRRRCGTTIGSSWYRKPHLQAMYEAIIPRTL